MPEITWNHWPLLFICVAMIVAAVIDGWKLKVPNWLTFPIILSGWALGGFYDVMGLPPETDDGSRIVASLVGTAVGFILLVPLYSVGGLGGGDVKMQMGFGSWIGAYYGLSTGISTIFYACILGILAGGVIGFLMILARREYGTNVQNTKEILTDFVAGGGIGTIAEKAKQRKPRLRLLPYGIPLCIGFVSYVLWTWPR